MPAKRRSGAGILAMCVCLGGCSSRGQPPGMHELQFVRPGMGLTPVQPFLLYPSELLLPCSFTNELVTTLAVFGIVKAKTCADIVVQYKWIEYVSNFIECCFLVLLRAGTEEPTHADLLRQKEFQFD